MASRLDVNSLPLVAHLVEMRYSAANILTNSREMLVRNAPFLTERPDYFSDPGIVAMRHARKQMVLDLIVQAAVQEGEEGPADIAAGGDLLVQEGLLRIFAPAALIEQLRAVEVVRNDEEERQVQAGHGVHGCYAQQHPRAARGVDREDNPPEHEEQPRARLQNAVREEHVGHRLEVLAADEVRDGLHHRVEAEQRQQGENVYVLRALMLQQRLRGVQPQEPAAHDVRVFVYIVAVDVMLHHMLVNPVHGAASDPVLRQTQQAVDPRLARHSSVICIVLDIQPNKRH